MAREAVIDSNQTEDGQQEEGGRHAENVPRLGIEPQMVAFAHGTSME